MILEHHTDKPALPEWLACPCSVRADLKLNSQGDIECSNPDCSISPACFLNTSGQPVLVNFEQSIFQQADYQTKQDGSVLNRRRSVVHRIIRNVIWGTNQQAKLNAQSFLQLVKQHSPSSTILIIGGGTIGSGSESLYQCPELKLISFDVYRSEFTDFVADAHSIPMKSESVDGVWIQAVLEHVLEPETVVTEIYRVLKPNGIVYAETPFMQQVHEKAYDFTRFTESGHRWLFRNFQLLDSGAIAGPGTVLVWSVRYFFASLLRSKKLGILMGICFFWLRYFDRIMPRNYISDAASGVFFMGKKSNQPIHPREMINFYRGVR